MKPAHERYEYKESPGSSHFWAINTLAGIPADSRVLDIGPGSGIIGQKLKDQGVEELYAVEIDAAAREHVKRMYKSVEETIEPFTRQQFDVILLLDVLEHMTDPFSFFDRLIPMLNPNGKILISLPNVAHWSVRLPLLFGVFNYYDRGILDRTHFQFFTRKRVKQLASRHGELQIQEMSSSIEPVEFVLPPLLTRNVVFRTLSQWHHAVAKALPGMFAYQHLMLVRKIS